MKMHGRATTTILESLFFNYNNYQAPLTKKNQLISYSLFGTLPRKIFHLQQLPLSSNLKNPFSSNRSLKNQPKVLLKRSHSPSKYLPTNTKKSPPSHSLLPLINEFLPFFLFFSFFFFVSFLPSHSSALLFTNQQAWLAQPLSLLLLNNVVLSNDLCNHLFSATLLLQPPFLSTPAPLDGLRDPLPKGSSTCQSPIAASKKRG